MKKSNKNKEKEIARLKHENKQLKDEVDSLWAMMDEMTKSDIENWSHLMEELKADVVSRSLMITKKVADA
tara:strand:+ start:1499 stop:1708 length:210 start_codon:yes stop_codon:yes gene_type:complete